MCRVGFRKGRVKGTVVLPVRELRAYPLNQIGMIEARGPARHGPALLTAPAVGQQFDPSQVARFLRLYLTALRPAP